MLPRALWLLCLTALSVRAQDDDESSTASDESSSGSSTEIVSDETRTTSAVVTDGALVIGSVTVSTLSTIPTSDFDGTQFTYLTYTTQETRTSTANASMTDSTSNSQITRQTTQESLIQLGPTGGSNSTTTSGSSTSSAPLPENTIPCNGWPELCNRQYSNITEVCSHNSAFIRENNAASNQELDIVTQLNDGVRMIQGETQWMNETETVMCCHSSCDLLNAGTFQDELETVAGWVADHPYDVVTWLIVNTGYISVDKYVPAIQNSGIAPFLYEPQYVPQRKDQWPTLAELILSGKRVVMFMDYQANQTEVPYILDEFTHMFETPFSPTNQDFPCNKQRPPPLSDEDARNDYMYLANHNLNTAIDVSAILGTGGGGDALLIPNTAEINQTNGEYNTYGQLGAMNENCTELWDRPPNFLLVDFYNRGDPGPGSVFEVAAKANGLTYDRQCCGKKASAASAQAASLGLSALVAGAVASILFL